MKILKTLSVYFLLGAAMINSTASASTINTVINLSEIPAKTVCIQNPSAAVVNKFFSETTVLSFEVYKSGSKEEITKIAEELTFVRQENDRKGKTYELMKNNLTKGLNKATQDIRAKEELIEFMKKQYEELENKGEIKRLKDYIQFLEKYKEEGNEKSIIDKKNYEDTIKNTIEMYEEKLNTIRMEKSVSVPDVVPTELAVITPVITPITELKNNDPVIKKEN